MSLLDEIAANRRQPGTLCRVASVLAEMPDAAELIAALKMTQVQAPSSAIGRALRARDYTISDDQVTYHRRRDCKCP